jgi:hypothetical protein
MQERDELRDPPMHRWGTTLTCIGQRSYLFGGWEHAKASHRNNNLILDFEDELERRRRQELEFHAKLERERVSEESLKYSEKLLTKYELAVLLRAEQEREAKESEKMKDEDIRSSFPPLFKPSPVRCMKANRSSVWLSWDRVEYNTREKRVSDSANITYMLYKKAGLKVLLKGDRVRVKQESSSRVPYFEGVISALNMKGDAFTVVYDLKRGIEKGIKRERLSMLIDSAHSANPLDFNPFEERPTIQLDTKQWDLLYCGPCTSYACTSLVPDFLLDRDPTLTHSFTFILQVCGVDYPLYEYSLPSDPAVISTAKEVNLETMDSSPRPKKEVYRFINTVDKKELQFERRDNEFSSIGTFHHYL